MLPNDPSHLWSSVDLSFPNYTNDALDHSPQLSSPSEHALALDYMSIPTADDAADSASNFHGELDMFQGYLNAAATGHDLSPESEVPASHHLPEANAMAMAKLTTPQVHTWGLQDWTPDSQNGTQFIDDGLAALQASQNAFSQAMYQSTIEGYHAGNLSCQTFATASSSDGEQPSLMTPPPRRPHCRFSLKIPSIEENLCLWTLQVTSIQSIYNNRSRAWALSVSRPRPQHCPPPKHQMCLRQRRRNRTSRRL